MATKYELYVVLSSSKSVKDGIVPGPVAPQTLTELWGNARNAGEGTDNTFGNSGADVESPDGSTDTPSTPSTPSTPAPEESTKPADG